MRSSDFLEELRAIVGEDYVIDHREDLLVYEYDGSVDRSMPRAVVLPANSEEVSQVMALAYEAGVTVVGRGSGTGLSGGAITPPDGLQIAFPRMNRILEVDSINNHNCRKKLSLFHSVLNADSHHIKFFEKYWGMKNGLTATCPFTSN